MSDIALTWDGSKADFELRRGLVMTPEGDHYVEFTGTGQVSSPASTAVNTATAGQFGIRAKVALDDWTPASAASILDQSDSGGTSRFYLNVNPSGVLAFGLSEDGGIPASELVSTVAVSAAAGEAIWIRADVDPSGANEINFYTSTDGSSWSALGTAVALLNTAGPSADVDMWIGRGRDVGGQLAGKVYRVEVRDGIGAGTIVAVFDAEDGIAGATVVTGTTGEDWTLSGAASLIVEGLEVVDEPAYDVEVDDGLRTAVMLSLFSDARSSDDEVVPDGSDDRRGWWGDPASRIPNDVTGSKLWLLSRAKQTPDLLRKAEQYARDSLAWMLEDRVASEVQVVAEYTRAGMLGMAVTVVRPRVAPVTYRFAAAWSAEAGR